MSANLAHIVMHFSGRRSKRSLILDLQNGDLKKSLEFKHDILPKPCFCYTLTDRSLLILRNIPSSETPNFPHPIELVVVDLDTFEEKVFRRQEGYVGATASPHTMLDATIYPNMYAFHGEKLCLMEDRYEDDDDTAAIHDDYVLSLFNIEHGDPEKILNSRQVLQVLRTPEFTDHIEMLRNFNFQEVSEGLAMLKFEMVECACPIYQKYTAAVKTSVWLLSLKGHKLSKAVERWVAIGDNPANQDKRLKVLLVE